VLVGFRIFIDEDEKDCIDNDNGCNLILEDETARFPSREVWLHAREGEDECRRTVRRREQEVTFIINLEIPQRAVFENYAVRF